MFDKTLEVAAFIVQPLVFLTIVCWYNIKTIFHLLLHFEFRTLASVSRVKDLGFTSFWKVYGPAMATPEFHARIAPLVAQASGIVLDVGPGTGEWLPHFDLTKVTKVYGVEPNLDHHESLRKKIKENGLSDIYTVVPVGVEDLGTFGLDRGSIDSITTVQCLCSVPNSKTMIQDLYGYLKPGGQWILYEHVVTRETGVIDWYQWTIDLIWPHLVGGCSIRRDTEQFLRDSGDWSKINLQKPDGEPRYHMLPHVMGALVK